MSAPAPRPLAPPLEATPTASRLPLRLRIGLWRLQRLTEALELALAEARVEAGLPGRLGNPEMHGELERAQFALLRLSNYILHHVGYWGDEA
ncbi:hypothetical protein [Archangium violaceum]|uniref:Uncharacterized protein n=1 Tax=Archangium violaceum Cb vi76 TaxID=1406225 RepID=A0A084SND7_9BACT|nr:hypothetical protein [Archangium violaceum]KFA89972.1 hypothetical protein Q664_31525 [Archangium violaceum Cb vi76]